ncbi:MAG: type II secretion system F family protein [Thiotrichales bacterium]|nr:type II secretion system F family protein [Thiotrichales bacterium]MCY4285382.1 type II secretion system F family protein [Thiotrichales bacterium]
MPLMRYKAVDERGRKRTGEIEAANPADLEARLARLGLDLVTFREARVRRALRRARVRRGDLVGFCFHMEQLLTAGVPVLEGLATLRDSAGNPRLREVLADMVVSIEGGATLSGAMREHPRVFEAVFVNLVHAGELSGRVGEILGHLNEHLKWQNEQIALMRRLLTYPAIAGAVVMLVVFFLMTHLVPQLVSFIEGMGQALPAHTRALILVSDLFVAYWYLALTAPVAAFLLLRALGRASPAVAHAVDAFKLRTWLVGPIMQRILLARFAGSFALLYASGITVLECIRICEGIAGNRAVEDATRRAGAKIAEGAGISAGFEATGLFSPLVLRMLRLGESTGALDAALLNVSRYYNRGVSESMEQLQAMIGPTITVVLGAILFWVIFSVLGPIYDLIATIGI